MPTKALFSVVVYSQKKKVLTLNEVRDNGNFRALKTYLDNRIKSGTFNTPLVINLYYKGIFQRQIRYQLGDGI
jgi:hypothetical protein